MCATTKKAKACKNCSCGLAEELEEANRVKNVSKPPDTSNAKSSCGSVSEIIINLIEKYKFKLITLNV